MLQLKLNGKDVSVDAPGDMPLLWVLRDILGMTGTKFGCGVAQCGACTVHVDGAAGRSCSAQLATSAGKAITTIEAIGETPAGAAVQKAWLGLEVVQCGYCQSGQIMSASALLASTRSQPMPTSMRQCPATSAAAERTFASVKRSKRRPVRLGSQ